MRAVDKIQRASKQVCLNRFHPLTCQWARIDNGLLAYAPEAMILRRVILFPRLAIQNTARLKETLEGGVISRIIGLFRLLLGIEVIKITEEGVLGSNPRNFRNRAKSAR